MCTSDLEFLGIWNHNIELSINAKCWNLVMRFMSDQMAQRLQVLSYFSPWKIRFQTQFWLVHLGLTQTHMAAIWVLRLLDVNGIQWARLDLGSWLEKYGLIQKLVQNWKTLFFMLSFVKIAQSAAIFHCLSVICCFYSTYFSEQRYDRAVISSQEQSKGGWGLFSLLEQACRV